MISFSLKLVEIPVHLLFAIKLPNTTFPQGQSSRLRIANPPTDRHIKTNPGPKTNHTNTKPRTGLRIPIPAMASLYTEPIPRIPAAKPPKPTSPNEQHPLGTPQPTRVQLIERSSHTGNTHSPNQLAHFPLTGRYSRQASPGHTTPCSHACSAQSERDSQQVFA